MEERIYVPNNKKIKEEILKENHDSADVGHQEQHRMLELIKRTTIHIKVHGRIYQSAKN